MHQNNPFPAPPRKDDKPLSVGIVVSLWNSRITEALLQGALDTLREHRVDESRIWVVRVPGAVELTYAARQLAAHQIVDAIIVLGCVIKGETPHFEYVCQSVTQGVTGLNLSLHVPVIFGVLTTLTEDQAIARAGGALGNKGAEAALTALHMAAINYRQPLDLHCRLVDNRFGGMG
ncbi:MAG: 6,7-dimethyl-8-ribityllumazine synthase [Tannerellaceae bacterium]|jgi:6,7-dimethyl-8-ribityllumazine synthase|nr:6,7-dimethyl-8-ribityllumazine synthase [Tannerellaceae bacterium]